MSLTHSFKIKVITIDEGIPGYRNEALEMMSVLITHKLILNLKKMNNLKAVKKNTMLI